jgi:ADP-ribose pyrophosphatase YjhB (NUDIX family)
LPAIIADVSLMAHLFYDLDFTVSVFAVHEAKVLLVAHKKLGKWLPLGGHIEIGEDPEQAVYREVREESGLEIELCGERPPGEFPGTKFLVAPAFLDVHDIHGDHRHIGMIYFARAASAQVRLASAEHDGIRWFSLEDLGDARWAIPPAIQFYGREAIRRLSPRVVTGVHDSAHRGAGS